MIEINKVDAAKPAVFMPSSPTNITQLVLSIREYIWCINTKQWFCYIDSSTPARGNGYATCCTTAQTGGGLQE